MQLTAEQQRKVEDNMGLVGKVIKDKVHNPEGIFSYDDLFQIGCIGLCKAAATDKGGCFSTYAYRLIWNEICDALIRVTRLSHYECSIEETCSHRSAGVQPMNQISQLELQMLIQNAKKRATGVTAKGIECLELSVAGYKSREIAANDAQELHDLRELIFNQQEGRFESTQASNDISFPYTSSNRIVVFGGHESWAREIKPKLPMVRFVDRESVPNVNMIRNADVIWIQTNALCHPHFYKIVDEAKKNNVPIRYFSYASPTKCAEQLVVEDRKMR